MTKTLSQKLRRRGINPRRRRGFGRRRIFRAPPPFIGPRLPNGRVRGRMPQMPVTNIDQPQRSFRNIRGNRRRNGRRQGGILNKLVSGAGNFVSNAASAVATGLGTGIGRVFGVGDYIASTPNYNTMMDISVASGGPPAMSPLSSGVRISHREYLRDVYSSVDFTTFSFALNPGMQIFPWLASCSKCFEEYKIHGMVFYLNTTSGVGIASTNTSLGYWGMVTQYDAADAELNTKQECENYVGCQSAVVWKNIIHGIECAPRANVLDKHFVRDGPVGLGDDIRFYDWGRTQFFTGGAQQDNNTLGELWVSYDIEFSKPKIPESGLGNPLWMKFYNNSSITQTNIAGNPTTQYVDGPLAGAFSWNNNVIVANGDLVLPTGNYLFYLQLIVPSGVYTPPNMTQSAAWTASNLLDTAGGMNLANTGTYSLPTANTVTTLSKAFGNKLGSNIEASTLSFSGAVFAGNPNAVTLWIIYLGNDTTLNQDALQKKRLELELTELRTLVPYLEQLKEVQSMNTKINYLLDIVHEEDSENSDNHIL